VHEMTRAARGASGDMTMADGRTGARSRRRQVAASASVTSFQTRSAATRTSLGETSGGSAGLQRIWVSRRSASRPLGRRSTRTIA
jgi:hypothetical protein